MTALILTLSIIVLANANNACVQDPVVNNPSGGMNLGGFRNLTVDKNVLTAAQKCNMAWNQIYNEAANFHKVLCVRNVQGQVVAGMNYKINVTLSETVCAKPLKGQNIDGHNESDLNACALKSNGSETNCVFECWVQTWLRRYELRSQMC